MAVLATLVCLVVPGIMLAEGWDDHDRSNRTPARDLAADYLNSCAPNAILFTNGDNDTFPLWYAQEVEGIPHRCARGEPEPAEHRLVRRPDAPQGHESEPVPFGMEPEKYRQGTRDISPAGFPEPRRAPSST